MTQKEIWAADCETDPFKEGRTEIKPFIWGCYNGGEYREFSETGDFVKFISERDAIVYAHNGGKFDWFFVLPWLEQFSDLMIINGRLAKFKIGNCEFRDSYNILPIPLAQYKKDDIDYAIMEKGERDKPKNRRLIQDYLRSDCVYLWELVTQFRDKYGGGLTLAGSALKFWLKMDKRKKPKTTQDFYARFAAYYYGGRVEVFRSGIINNNFTVIDINSAYPYAMKHLHPYGDSYAVSTVLPDTDAYISRCFIELRAASLGAFPYREKTGLSFPSDGQLRLFFVTGWEYLAARDTGTLRDDEIISVIQFADSVRFDDYIDHFYAEKSNSEKGSADYIFAKLFLNSLYGKMAANPDHYKEFTVCALRYIDAAESDGYQFASLLTPDAALMQRDLPDEKRHYLNVATAASITGFVRAYLWRAIKKCTGVIYCDTDSIAAESTGDLKLSDTELGAWDKEADCDFGAVAGKKLYAFRYIDGGKEKWKTASKGARLTAEEIIQVAKGVPVIYNPIAPTFSLKNGIKIISRKIVKNVAIGEK